MNLSRLDKILAGAIILLVGLIIIAPTWYEYDVITDLASTDEFLIYDADDAQADNSSNITWAALLAEIKAEFPASVSMTTPIIGAATGTSLVLSGNLQGTIPVTVTTAATLVMTAANTKGDLHQNGDADVIDYTLPGAAAGLSACFFAGEFTGVITIDPVDATDTIYLDGASVGAGDAIDSPGTVGDFICLAAVDATKWYTFGRSGTWVDGGVD
jgi:hypothetical protein